MPAKNNSNSFTPILLGLFLILILAAFAASIHKNRLEIGKLRVVFANGSSQNFNVYLAATLQEQVQGLMNKTSIGTCNGLGNCLGMLFVYQNSSSLCFWMENTPLPLKQLWITNNIVTAEENGVPYSTAIYCHIGEMVLEVPMNSSVGMGASVYLNGTAG